MQQPLLINNTVPEAGVITSVLGKKLEGRPLRNVPQIPLY